MLQIELARLYIKLSIYDTSGYVHSPTKNQLFNFFLVLHYIFLLWITHKNIEKKFINVQDAWANWNFSGVKPI